MDTPPEIETPVQAETAAPAETETVTATPTLEELQKKLDDANRHAKNKAEEAERNFKKLQKFEKAEAERKTAEMSDLEKAQAEIAEYKQELLKAQKSTIAARHGLPETWVKRIQGATVEEMEADAAELAASLPSKTAPTISSTAPASQAALTPEAIRKMSHAEVNANWERIAQTMANQK